MSENLRPLIQMYFGLVTEPTRNAIALLILTESIVDDADKGEGDFESEQFRKQINFIKNNTTKRLGISYVMSAYILSRYLYDYKKGSTGINNLNHNIIIGNTKFTISDIFHGIIEAVSKLTKIIITISKEFNVEWNFIPKSPEDYMS